ncbi:MAG TPA: hypothetical protein VGM84_12300 [Steroidobacteraceae bacterium]|jgi:DNA-binding beta-propeller fold protein YncE
MFRILIIALATFVPAAFAADATHYRLAREVPLAGSEGWDYLTYDAGRLFVSHGSHVQVLDGAKLSVVGDIADTPGVHGIAIASDIGHGFVSAGRSDSVVVFDLKSLARLAEIKVTGANPDAILYEPTTHRVFTFNGRGRNATAIDAKTNAVLGTIPLDAKPEFAATDGAGHVFVNLEDKSSLAVIDPQKLTVLSVWPLTGCEEPSGLAIDVANHRLFSVCDNKVMAVTDSTSGKVVAHVPIGGRVDAAAYDPGTHLAFASGGDGTLTVVKEGSPTDFSVVQSVKTKAGARTMALDVATHRAFSVTATPEGGPPPARPPAASGPPAAGGPPPRPRSFKDFELLEITGP